MATAHSSRLRVLLVENDDLIQLATAEMVGELGYEIVGLAKTAQEAFEHAVALNPDVVLLDIELDGPETGIDAAKRLAARAPTPIIFVTGAPELLQPDDLLPIVAMEIVRKPFALLELDRALRRAECHVRRCETFVNASNQRAVGIGPSADSAIDNVLSDVANIIGPARTPISD